MTRFHYIINIIEGSFKFFVSSLQLSCEIAERIASVKPLGYMPGFTNHSPDSCSINGL